MPALRHNYLRTLRKASDATRPICEKVHCLESMAKFLALFNSIDEKTQFILKFGDDRDLVEFAILTPFASLEELAEGLESFFLQNVSLKNMLEPEPRGLPPFTGLLSKNEDYFDNNFDGGVKKGLLKVRATWLSRSIRSGVQMLTIYYCPVDARFFRSACRWLGAGI